MILPERLFRGGSEALWGRALPQIGKMRYGSYAGRLPSLSRGIGPSYKQIVTVA